MPIYYFHLHNDEDVRDEEGQEFASLDEARTHAKAQSRAFVGEQAKETGRINLSHFVDIEDEDGKVLDRVIFKDVITIEG